MWPINCSENHNKNNKNTMSNNSNINRRSSSIRTNPRLSTAAASTESPSSSSIGPFKFVALLLCASAALLNGRADARISRRDLPMSMDKEMFPMFTFQPQDFDEEAPICLAEREPCGFYSFSLDGKAPLKWIKSWCRCSSNHECVYERTDMRMRVYRQTCVLKAFDEADELEEEAKAAASEQQLNGLAYKKEEAEEMEAATSSSTEMANQTALPPAHSPPRHQHHHHHHHRHTRKANRRVIRRLRAIYVD